MITLKHNNSLKFVKTGGKNPGRERVFNSMKDPFAKFQKKRDDKIIQSVINSFILLSKGKSDEEVLEATGLNKEDIQRVKKILGSTKEWDEIDKIADENSGHYVVPTTPGEVDTLNVSEYIKKIRKERDCNGRKNRL